MVNKEMLKQTGEWYLWHHYKNENALLYVIVGSFLAFFMHSGWIISLFIWIIYGIYCTKNNQNLNNNPEILRDREWWLKSYEEKGMLEEYKRVLGI